MKLTAVTVQLFRNFVAPQRVVIEDDVTALVGKNESGKTTILHALHRLNPANGDEVKFDLVTEYPRWRLSRDRRTSNLSETEPVVAEFSPDEEDRTALGEVLPAPLLEATTVTAGRTYANTSFISLSTPLQDVIRDAASVAAVDAEDAEALLGEMSLDDAIAQAKALSKELKESAPARAKALGAFPKAAEERRFLLGGGLDQAQRAALWKRVPKFFYFSSYSVLPGEVDLTKLAEQIERGERLDDQDRTVVALLAHAGVTPDDFLDEDYASRKAELQAAASDLSQQVFKYWRANTDLSVVFGDDKVEMPSSRSVPQHHRFLMIELRDARHGDVETNFSTRSTGFQWFFSFFAAFSEHQNSDEPIVVLLDEPGTSLHGEAQKDLVKYIFDELGTSKQTVYTTHSQFMIDPGRYEKLRAVHDRATREDKEAGVVVTLVSLSADRDTVLPVESALGYTMSQHLFLGSGHHLLVEGSSDFVYLTRMSAHAETTGATGLSPKLTIIPVGGQTNMPAFVALMGRRLEVSVLIDGAKTTATSDRVKRAGGENGIPPNRFVAVSQVGSLPSTADIEDLFAPVDYLRLYNWAFGTTYTIADLPTTGEPIIRKLTALRGGEFDHALPAHALTGHTAEFFKEINEITVERFGRLFGLLNAGLV
ncbi:MAG: ATP-binding protein [Micrococcales bacterium]|nr:ATP-binding protein [Micrococcales bacterium]